MESQPQSATESSSLALNDQQAQSRRNDDEEGEGEDEEEAEVEKLEEEVKEMAEKLLRYRSTLPDQLRSGFAAVLAAKRPQIPVLDRGSEAGSAGDPDQDPGSHGESSEGVVAAVEDQETSDRIRLLKEKISSNISAMPLVLKRMNECISRIDKVNSCNDIIYPAFKRKKPT